MQRRKIPTRQNENYVEEKSIKQFALQGTGRGNFPFDLTYLHPGLYLINQFLKKNLHILLFDYNLLYWLRAKVLRMSLLDSKNKDIPKSKEKHIRVY